MDIQRAERRLAAILSADVVGYSRLMALDEEDTVQALDARRRRVTTLCAEHRGRLVDFTGDNFLAEFSAASDALGCALAIHDAVRELDAERPRDRAMQFRIGIHVGEIRAEAGRLFGSGVNIAARLEQLAGAAETCISSVVLDQVRRRPGLAFEDLGPQQLKNLPEAVQVFRVTPSDVRSQARPARDDASIAVLAFVNMSADPDQEYFADGMAQEIIKALTHVEDLRVSARTSAFSFKGTSADIATIGRRLDVATILEGSVRKAGERVRVSGELIDVASGRILWSETFDRALDDVFQIQDEIARTIVRTIRPKLLRDRSAPLVARRTRSPEAYELYLRAGERIARFERWDTRTAIEMLDTATTIDPGYADAWARLALAFSQLGFAFEPDERWVERAEAAVRRAFELDPASAEDALVAEPGDATRLNCIGQAAQFQGRFEEAEEYLDRAYRADPTLWLNHTFRAPIRLYRDDLGGAEQVLQTARQVLPDDQLVASCEALLWAKRGEPGRADEALVRASRSGRSIAHVHHSHHYLAAAQAVLGRPVEAVRSLRLAVELGFPSHPAFWNDPHLLSLRDRPEMQTLLGDLERSRAGFAAEFGSA